MEKQNLLIDFLQKEGIYEKFKENFDPEFAGMQFDEYLEKHKQDHEAINLAFKWLKSPQRHLYWRNNANNWKNFLESVNENKLQSAIATLKTYNDWYRGAEIEQPDPTEIGEAIALVLTELKARP